MQSGEAGFSVDQLVCEAHWEWWNGAVGGDGNAGARIEAGTWRYLDGQRDYSGNGSDGLREHGGEWRQCWDFGVSGRDMQELGWNGCWYKHGWGKIKGVGAHGDGVGMVCYIMG